MTRWAHMARDELGISKTFSARPIQAALASAGSFAVGAALPLIVTAIVPEKLLIYLVSGASLFFLALLGGLAARLGRGHWGRSGSRFGAH
jgi:vacuolar iron transporter family protein